jgi:hypothetical protein
VEVREGVAFCLSLPLDCPRLQLNPRRFPPEQSFSMRGDDPVMNYPSGRAVPGMKEVVCDDRVLLAQYADPAVSFDPHQCSGLDGFDEKLQRWVADSDVAALVSDNEAVEFMPDFVRQNAHGVRVPLHHLCLFKLDIPLGEFFLLSDLADWLRTNHRSRFLFTAPPPRLPGAVGSPVTGVGTV